MYRSLMGRWEGYFGRPSIDRTQFPGATHGISDEKTRFVYHGLEAEYRRAQVLKLRLSK